MGSPYIDARLTTRLYKENALAQLMQQQEAALAENSELQAARLRGIESRRSMLRDESADCLLICAAEAGLIARTDDVSFIEFKDELFFFEFVPGEILFPIWQFDSIDGVLPSITPIMRKLLELDPWTNMQFFRSHVWADDQSTIEYLRNGGDIEKAVFAAEYFAENGWTGW